MERTVPSTASEEIELYIRTMYSLLRSTTEVQIRTLEEVHAAMNSLLHPNARDPFPDMSAFIYSILRLPPEIASVRSVILGQSTETFFKHGYGNVESWERTGARARRRRYFYNGSDTLICYIASRTDIEDLIPTLTAYQIEWNKIHMLLLGAPRTFRLESLIESPEAFESLAEILQISVDDLKRLQTVWGNSFLPMLEEMRQRTRSMRIRLLGGSMIDYWRTTRIWWDNIEAACSQLLERPVYFISSNMHSLSNLLSGYALSSQPVIESYLQDNPQLELHSIWNSIRTGQVPASMENFLYFALREYQSTPDGREFVRKQIDYELEHGIHRIASEHSFDVDAQVIELSGLNPEHMDARIRMDTVTGAPEDLSFLAESDALLLNIDYPLGLAAYNILAKVAEYVNPILGVYVMGKAATLNGVLGDVMIPNVVQDEHSANTYLFQNVFSAADVAPNLTFGTVLDNQKAVSVFGTFLQNAKIMDVFYREGFTDLEMEAGPYLSAIYEMYRPKQHPTNEIVNLYNVPFDIGMIHYASDTPLSKGKNLGAGALSYFGLDSTYASSIAILRRIFKLERERLAQKQYATR